MSQAKLFFLAHGHDVDHFGHMPDLFEHLPLAGALKNAFQLQIVIEMILDDALVPVGDENDVLDPGAHGFFHNILHHRLVVDRQHFLGDVLAGRQRAGSPPGHGNNDFTNVHGASPVFDRATVPA